MFAKIFALFALLAVAFAAPNPAPAPTPQYVTYSSGLDYVYPGGAVVPSLVSPYSAYPAPLNYPSGIPAPVFVR